MVFAIHAMVILLLVVLFLLLPVGAPFRLECEDCVYVCRRFGWCCVRMLFGQQESTRVCSLFEECHAFVKVSSNSSVWNIVWRTLARIHVQSIVQSVVSEERVIACGRNHEVATKNHHENLHTSVVTLVSSPFILLKTCRLFYVF